MRVTIEPKEYDVQQYARWAVGNEPNLMRRIRSVRRNAAVLTFMIGAMLSGLAWFWAWSPAGFGLTSFAAMVTGGWLFILAFIAVVRPSRDMLTRKLVESSRHRFEYVLAPAVLEPTEEGLRIESAFGNAVHFWNSYTFAPLVETRLLLIRGDDLNFPVPRRCFESDEQFADFCEEVWAHVPSECPSDA